MRSDDPIATLAAADPARRLPPLDRRRAAELAARAIDTPAGALDDLVGPDAPGGRRCEPRRGITGRRVLAVAAILAIPIGASAAVPGSPLRDLLGSGSESRREGPDFGRFGLARSVLPEELARDPHATGVLTADDFEDLGVRTEPTPLRLGSTLLACTVPAEPAPVACRSVRTLPIDRAHPEVIPAGTHWYRAKPRPGAAAVLGTSDDDPGFAVHFPERRLLVELGPDGGTFWRTTTTPPPEAACDALPPDAATESPGLDATALATLRATCARYRALRRDPPSGP